MAITATTTGVSGPAGAGKSTTAAVLARDPLVHAEFPDGVTWLAFGRERTGAAVLSLLAERLGVAAEKREICRALDGQKRLLVLDDIWTAEQLDTFSSLTAERGHLGKLVTTRNDELAGEHKVAVACLEEEEGLRVLAGYMGTAAELRSDAVAKRLVEMCCGNPAMLRSVAALCKKKGLAPTLEYLEQCRQNLRHAKLPKAGDYEYRTLFDALGGMLQFLGDADPALAERCTMLAIFPEDSQVPLSVAGQLWGTNKLETEEVVTELASWHLIDVDWQADRRRLAGDVDWQESTGRGCTLSLIDLHLDYLRASAKQDLPRWHAALLHGRRKLSRECDSYWGTHTNILHHLNGCGKELARVGGCSDLQTLDLSRCTSLASLPESLGECKQLRRLQLGNCTSLASLSESLGECKELRKLQLILCESLASLPASLGGCKELLTLDLHNCTSLASLPKSLGGCKKLQELDLRGCTSLAFLPESLGECKQLQTLVLQDCASLASVPESLGECKQLWSLDMCGCASLASLPKSLGECKQLQMLHLGGCTSLASLPASLGECKRLQNLKLANCPSLASLPDLSGLENLSQDDLSAFASERSDPTASRFHEVVRSRVSSGSEEPSRLEHQNTARRISNAIAESKASAEQERQLDAIEQEQLQRALDESARWALDERRLAGMGPDSEAREREAALCHCLFLET